MNFDRLPSDVQEAARAAGLDRVCNNPFKGIIVRAVETLYACDEALRIIDTLEMPERPSIEVEPRVGTGFGCTEAPRGSLYHRYRIDERGLIAEAKIVPPTGQNLKTIEQDLVELVPANLGMEKSRLQWRCEAAVRNYDPCISCATHFLKLTVERR